MSTELSLLHAFCVNREWYLKYHGYIKSTKNIDRDVRLLFNLVDTYYTEREVTEISRDDLLMFYELRMPNAKDRDLHIDSIKQAFSIEVSDDTINELFDHMVERQTASTIITQLLPVVEGDKFGIVHTLGPMIDEYVDTLNNPPESIVVPEPCMLSVKELVEQEILDTGIPWHLPILDRIIGGVRPKTLGLIYAYVDSGKTSFAVRSMAHQAQFLKPEEVICYAGNEEAAPRLRLRAIQAFINWSRTQIRENIDAAESLALERGLDKVRIFDEITSGEQIKYILKEYKPRILYVDQSTDVDIETKRKSDGVEYLKQLFKWYRRLANSNNTAIIGVSQGVGDAENTKYLKLSDIYGSRIAIQGALDYAIGIGRLVNDDIDENRRYFNIPKNKLHDGDGGQFVGYFTKQQCLWEEV